MPDANGKIKGILVPELPWLKPNPVKADQEKQGDKEKRPGG